MTTITPHFKLEYIENKYLEKLKYRLRKCGRFVNELHSDVDRYNSASNESIAIKRRMLNDSTISRFAYERNIFAAHLRASLELRKSVISVFIRNAKMEEGRKKWAKRWKSDSGETYPCVTINPRFNTHLYVAKVSYWRRYWFLDYFYDRSCIRKG